MTDGHVTIFSDGASRGNPGRAAIAYVIIREGHSDICCSDTIGVATNNVAEYTAMIQALAAARDMNAASVHLNSDSELMVRQLRGEYRVKSPDIQPLYEEAMTLARSFRRVHFAHVPRAENAHADKLANEALDGNPTTPVFDDGLLAAPPARPPAVAASSHDIVEHLESLRRSWSHGHGPSAEEAWAELEALLKKRKLLKTTRGRSPR